ncbi:MAG: hypothetical protein JWO38_5743 [Gemmataceae bacterium]|nr:hypothetical protein [Gemmataceae bacterium]
MTPRHSNLAGGQPGLTIIELLVVMAILSLLVGLSLSGVQRVRVAATRAQCLNNTRQIALAVHSYAISHQRLPTGYTPAGARDLYHNLGWQARVLPYLDQQPLWDQIEKAFALAPNGDMFSPPHSTVLATVLPIFGCPADSRVRTWQLAYTHKPVALTSYLGVVGTDQSQCNGTLYVDSAVRIGDIADGTSQTLLLGERPPSTDFVFGWWYRGLGQQEDGSADMVLGVREQDLIPAWYTCPRGPYQFGPGRVDNQCDMFHFWSMHPGGGTFAFADGSARLIRYEAASVMPALATRAGRETVSLPD